MRLEKLLDLPVIERQQMDKFVLCFAARCKHGFDLTLGLEVFLPAGENDFAGFAAFY